MYAIIDNLYRLGKLTAAQVWEQADKGVITLTQAASICGARPNAEDNADGG